MAELCRCMYCRNLIPADESLHGTFPDSLSHELTGVCGDSKCLSTSADKRRKHNKFWAKIEAMGFSSDEPG